MKCFKQKYCNLSFWEALNHLKELEEQDAFISFSNLCYGFYFDNAGELSKVDLECDSGSYCSLIYKDDIVSNKWEVWVKTSIEDKVICLSCLDDEE